jgi:hypothetical protein
MEPQPPLLFLADGLRCGLVMGVVKKQTRTRLGDEDRTRAEKKER